MLYNFYNTRISEAHYVCIDFCEYTQLIWELLHEKFTWELGQVHICQCRLPLAWVHELLSKKYTGILPSFCACLHLNKIFSFSEIFEIFYLFYIPPQFPSPLLQFSPLTCFRPLTSTPRKRQGLLWESTKHGILRIKILDSWLTVHICELITKQFWPVSFHFSANETKRKATKGSACQLYNDLFQISSKPLSQTCSPLGGEFSRQSSATWTILSNNKDSFKQSFKI